MFVQLVDDLNLLNGSTESKWYCTKAIFPKYLESFLDGIPFHNSFQCRLPTLSQGAKFDVLVIEEVAHLPGRNQECLLVVEKQGSYSINIINAKSASKILESHNCSSTVNLYCLSIYESFCPNNFTFIQSMKEFSFRSPSIVYRPLDNAVFSQWSFHI
mgnify:CR=1 FL=1